MTRFFPVLLLLPALLVSCSGTKLGDHGSSTEAKTTSASMEAAGKKKGSSMFSWRDSDVQRGRDGSITGGKRSEYDQRKQASLGKKGKRSSYLDKDYVTKRWQGSKDFAKGSYSTKGYAESGKASRFSGRRNGAGNKQASASGQTFATKNFGTSSARERGRGSIATPTSRFHGKSANMTLPVYDNMEDFRNLSVNQTRSWLGRDR